MSFKIQNVCALYVGQIINVQQSSPVAIGMKINLHQLLHFKEYVSQVHDSFQYSSNTHPQYFQYRIQLCGTPEQTISHSQLFSSLETIGKQISNVNVKVSLDIFGCACLKRQQHSPLNSLAFVDWWIKQIGLDLKIQKEVSGVSLPALPLTSLIFSLLSLISVFFVISCFWIIGKLSFFTAVRHISASLWAVVFWLTFLLPDWTMKATMRYLDKAVALCIDWAKAQHPFTKKRLKYQTCLRHLWSLRPQSMLKWSTYIIVHLCELHWDLSSTDRVRKEAEHSTAPSWADAEGI